MIRLSACVGFLLSTAAPVWAQADPDAPLSAIDWLSESVEQPEVIATAPIGTPNPGTQATRTPTEGEAPVSENATAPSVSVQTLGAPPPAALGLFSPSSVGMPENLWVNSDLGTLSALVQAERLDTLPALRDLQILLLITQADAPFEGDTQGTFFLTRVDRLLDLGALELAQAMIEDAGPDTPALFRRWFDVSLLTGTEGSTCRSLKSTPDIAPTPAARVFCLARSGDWSAAALTLNTSRALGDMDEDTADLVSRFLDPDLYEGEDALTPPDRISPLLFRMFEAIGEPLNTSTLPLAFSHADLRSNVGWKAQLEAAERLSRNGALSEAALIGAYTSRRPAASGGVWERAKAVQRLDAALADANTDDTVTALGTLWNEARAVGILVPLAKHYGPRLIAADLPADPVVFRWLLLSGDYELAALDEDLAATLPFFAALARGTPEDAPANGPGYARMRDAFLAPPSETLLDISNDGRPGEAILRTLLVLEQGLNGDETAFRDGIATLRALGLEDVARRAALQHFLLEQW